MGDDDLYDGAGFCQRNNEVVLFCGRRTPLWEQLRDEVPCEPIMRGFNLNPLTLRKPSPVLCRHHPEILLEDPNEDVRVTGLVAWLLGIPVVRRWQLDLPLRNQRPHHCFFYGRIPTQRPWRPLTGADPVHSDPAGAG